MGTTPSDLKDSGRNTSDNVSYSNQSLDEKYIMEHPLEVAPTLEQYKRMQETRKKATVKYHQPTTRIGST